MQISGMFWTRPDAVFLVRVADRGKEGQPLKKYYVVLVLFVLSMITYVDRVCISTAKDPISGEMHLSDPAMGLVFSAFALGYALAQIPSGWLADPYSTFQVAPILNRS